MQHQEARRKKEEESARQKMEDQRRKQEVSSLTCLTNKFEVMNDKINSILGKRKAKTAFDYHQATRHSQKIRGARKKATSIVARETNLAGEEIGGEESRFENFAGTSQT